MATDPREAAITYFDAWTSRDFDRLRELLAPDVVFSGPMATVSGVEDCVGGLRMMAETIEDIEIERIFVDGSDVLTWYNMHKTDQTVTPTVNWSHVSAGRIDRIRALFDTGHPERPDD